MVGTIIERVYELLCDGAGSEFTLPAGYFKRGTYSGEEPAEAVALAKETPRVFVDLRLVEPHSTFDMRSTHKHDSLVLSVRLDYAAPAVALTSEWVTAYGRIGDDIRKVRKLLESSVNTSAAGISGFVVGPADIESFSHSGLIRATLRLTAFVRS